jgi:hypothetical protein
MAVKVMHQGVPYTLDNGDRQKAYDLYEELSRDLCNYKLVLYCLIASW